MASTTVSAHCTETKEDVNTKGREGQNRETDHAVLKQGPSGQWSTVMDQDPAGHGHGPEAKWSTVVHACGPEEGR